MSIWETGLRQSGSQMSQNQYLRFEVQSAAYDGS
jgi:hypothetical protein